MKPKLTLEEMERRRAEVDARPAEDPTGADLTAFAAAEADAPEEFIDFEDYKAMREYSGRLMLRIPKELHRSLAESAKENGVSLNQYAMYKLAR